MNVVQFNYTMCRAFSQQLASDRWRYSLSAQREAVQNLCRMKRIGVEHWADEESADIRRKYSKGKFVVGVGPTL
jgi:hypothetical protein